MSNSGKNPLNDRAGKRESRATGHPRVPASAETRRPRAVTFLLISGATRRAAPSSTGTARRTIHATRLSRLEPEPNAFEPERHNIRVQDQRSAHLPHLISATLPLVPGQTQSFPDDEDYSRGWTVLYFYPGQPSDQRPGHPDDIALHAAYSHHHYDLSAMRVSVAGISTEPADVQQERRTNCAIPHDLLSDPELRLASALNLPTGELDGSPVYEPLALVMRDAVIQRAFYPIGDRPRHVSEVVAWIRICARG